MSASIASGTYPRTHSLGFGRPGSRSLGARIWRLLGEMGHARAEPHLRALAHQYAVTDPELAARLRAAADPAGLRHY